LRAILLRQELNYYNLWELLKGMDLPKFTLVLRDYDSFLPQPFEFMTYNLSVTCAA